LIYDEDLMPNLLRAQKAMKCWDEFKQVVEPVAEWNNDGHTMNSPRRIIAQQYRRSRKNVTLRLSRTGAVWMRGKHEVECAEHEYNSGRY